MCLEHSTRRGFVAGGAAALCGAAFNSSAIGTIMRPGDDSAHPAGAAGRLTIGGDLSVNRVGYGAMRITGEDIWGQPADPNEARAVLRRALELGVNFIDTADAYGPDVSEQLICDALHPYPNGLVIATKGGLTRPSRDQWVSDARPEHLRQACEASLRRLKLERIDLYQLHRPDPKVPLEDSIGELARLQQQGKIRHIGVSNVNPAQLAQAQGLVKIVSVQNRYNVADRSSDEVLALCQRQHIAFLPWAPLAQRAQAGGAPDARLQALESIAQQRHIDMPQATLAWLLARSPVMLPIPGTSRVEHLQDNVAAASVRLSRQEMERVG
ncbi:MAG TPA: aldo/keto reductase [Steroidobacteraceae bacterium]|jgi:aryl-alcohol dehydrogenase-like predicted oxidoreductase